MKIANLKFEIGRNADLKQGAAAGRKIRGQKKSEPPAVGCYKRNAYAPMRFEEMLYSIVLQPGKIRISSRRLQRWLEFFGKH